MRKTRKCIHETTVTIGGRYAQLYQHAPKAATAGRKGGHDSAPEGHNEDAPDLGSPYRPRPSQGGEGGLPFGKRSSSDESRASSDGPPLTFSGHAFRSSLGGIDRGITAVSGGTSFFGRGDGRQRSPTAGLSRVFRCRAAEEAAVPEAARKVAPEEEVFWTAAGVCKVPPCRARAVILLVECGPELRNVDVTQGAHVFRLSFLKLSDERR